MSSKAEELLLDKYNWDASHPDYSTASFRKDEVLRAMKEIASLAFNEGYAAAGCIGDASYEREEFISKLFNDED